MTRVPALQNTLAAEHAAIFLLAAHGGAVSATTSPDVHALLTHRHRVHRGHREFLTTTLRGLGQAPVAAAPAYEVPDDLESATVATSTASTTESRCASHYATLVGSTTDHLRDWAIAALADAARASVDWGQAPDPFPGAPELSSGL